MTDITTHVYQQLKSAWDKPLNKNERQVLLFLWERYAGDRRKVTQAEIADHSKQLGCHKFEEDIVRNKRESTLRQVRQIIRTLRIEYGVPILSDRNGYWIPYTQEEVQDYVDGMERTAKAQAYAWHETYKSVRNILNTTSSFFELYEPQKEENTSEENANVLRTN